MFRKYKEIGYFLDSIGKNSIFLFLVYILNAFSSFIVGVLISRYLGVVFFGEYVTAYNFYSIFYLFPTLGLGIFVIRELARDNAKANKYLINLSFISLIASMICVIIICVTTSLMKYTFNTKIATYIVVLSIFPNSLILLIQSFFIAFGEVRYAFFATITEALIKVALSVIALTLGYGINSLMAIHVLSKFIGLAMNIYFVFRITGSIRPEIDFAFCGRILKKVAFTFVIIAILGSIFTKIDILILSTIKQIAEVGWYGPASKFSWLGSTLILAIATSLLPILSRSFIISQELFRSSSAQFLKYLTAFLLPFLLVGFLMADWLIPFCFGKEFVNSILAFKILIWSIFFVGLWSFCDTILIAGNKQKLIIYTLSFSLLCNIILNIFFCRWWGYLGTSFAVLVSMGIFAALECLLVNKFMFKLRLASILGRPLLSIAIAGIFILFFKQRINFWLLILLSVLAYFLTLFSLKTFTREDIRFLRNFWNEYLSLDSSIKHLK